MPGVVVDTVVVETDVFSFVYKRDSRGAAYAKHLTDQPLHLAFATVAERYRWSVLFPVSFSSRAGVRRCLRCLGIRIGPFVTLAKSLKLQA